MATEDWGDEPYTVEELLLLIEAIDKKIWCLDHVGMRADHPRKLAFKLLRTRTITKLGRRKAAQEAGRPECPAQQPS